LIDCGGSLLSQRLETERALREAACVFAEDEARLLLAQARTTGELTRMVERRVAGEPLEYVLGWAEFCGIRVAVDPGLFVPRRRTEFLVMQAAAIAPARPVILDLCCGTGAIGAALSAILDSCEVYAVDIEPAAVNCARRNLAGGTVYEGDLYEPLPLPLRGRIDVIVANTPYVPSGDVGLLPREARIHEPASALDGGSDGLDVVRRICAQAHHWLSTGGHLVTETSRRQARRAASLFVQNRLRARIEMSNEFETATVLGSSLAH
jgi:release factor glutamine methyltransferase